MYHIQYVCACEFYLFKWVALYTICQCLRVLSLYVVCITLNHVCVAESPISLYGTPIYDMCGAETSKTYLSIWYVLPCMIYKKEKKKKTGR